MCSPQHTDNDSCSKSLPTAPPGCIVAIWMLARTRQLQGRNLCVDVYYYNGRFTALGGNTARRGEGVEGTCVVYRGTPGSALHVEVSADGNLAWRWAVI